MHTVKKTPIIFGLHENTRRPKIEEKKTRTLQKKIFFAMTVNAIHRAHEKRDGQVAEQAKASEGVGFQPEKGRWRGVVGPSTVGASFMRRGKGARMFSKMDTYFWVICLLEKEKKS